MDRLQLEFLAATSQKHDLVTGISIEQLMCCASMCTPWFHQTLKCQTCGGRSVSRPLPAMASAHAPHASQPTHFVFLSSYGDGARRWKGKRRERMYLDTPDWFWARLSEHYLQHLSRKSKSHISEKDHALGFTSECVWLWYDSERRTKGMSL